MEPFEQQRQFTSIPDELYTLRFNFPDVGFLMLTLKFPSEGFGCTNIVGFLWFMMM
jgi:hypothetical protein